MSNSAEIQGFLEKLKNSEKAVIVEGKKDKAALERLGVKNIFTLKKPLFAVVEEIAASYKEVIIFTDLDEEGKKLYGKLNSWLSYHGVKVDNYFREFLFRNTKIRQVEGLSLETKSSRS
jgi:5S rRNA maturation endonuclease (ribonuclease M5)